MAKNPIFQKAKQDGYNQGFNNGFEQGKYSACVFFAERFEGLQDIKGIGPKTMEIIVNHFGADYFKKVDK